jgi:hypothetical protein
VPGISRTPLWFALLWVLLPNALARGDTIAGTLRSAKVVGSGASVAIFAAASASPLALGSGVTDSNGDFSVTFSNPGGGQVLYAVTRGGDFGSGSNSAIAMIGILGTTQNFSSPVVIDEVTTIASVWSMSQFIQTDGSISGLSGPSGRSRNGAEPRRPFIGASAARPRRPKRTELP